MSSAFISYSRKDKKVADYIAAELRNRNVDVFIDYQRLQAGEFVSQLGRQIEEKTYFIVILSPRSITSKWVKAEIAWAFRTKTVAEIIPMKLEPVNLTDVFVLASLEQIDFTRWNVDRKMDEAIHKLARLMHLSVEPLESEPVPEPMLSEDYREEEEEEEEEINENVAPTFAKSDVTKIFQSAAAVQNDDPEQALFLYQRVLEIDPDFMNGGIKEFVKRQEADMKPIRLQKLKEQIEFARKQGHWLDIKQYAESMRSIDPENEYATQQVTVAEQNVGCEPIYEQAKIASKTGDIAIVNVLMKDISNTCPDFGDPAGLLDNQPITRDTLGFIRNTHTLEGHTGRITKVAFSHNASMLATASTDHVINIWSTFTGESLITLKEHSKPVNSVAFSPDDQYIASVSVDGKLNLWRVNKWELIQQAEYQTQLQDVVFAPDGRTLAICGNSGLLHIHDVPQINSFREIDIEHDIVAATFSHDGEILVCAQYITVYPTKSTVSKFSKIHLWETNTWEKANYPKIEKINYGSKITNSSFSLNDKLLLTTMGYLDIRTIPTGAEYYNSKGMYFEIYAASFLPTDNSLLVYSDDRDLNYFDLDSESNIMSEPVHSDTITSIAVSRDGRLIATGSIDCLVKIWQL